MKVCPVCQYEEEDGNEVSCAICGSDLESEGSSVEETITEEPVIEKAPIEDKSVESEDESESEISVSEGEETSEMIDLLRQRTDGLTASNIFQKRHTEEVLALLEILIGQGFFR